MKPKNLLLTAYLSLIVGATSFFSGCGKQDPSPTVIDLPSEQVTETVTEEPAIKEESIKVSEYSIAQKVREIQEINNLSLDDDIGMVKDGKYQPGKDGLVDVIYTKQKLKIKEDKTEPSLKIAFANNRLKEVLNDPEVNAKWIEFGKPRIQIIDYGTTKYSTDEGGINLQDKLSSEKMKAIILSQMPAHHSILSRVRDGEKQLQEIFEEPEIKSLLTQYKGGHHHSNPVIDICNYSSKTFSTDSYNIFLDEAYSKDEMREILLEQIPKRYNLAQDELAAERRLEKALADPEVKKHLREYGNPEIKIVNFSRRTTYPNLAGISLDDSYTEKDMKRLIIRDLPQYKKELEESGYVLTKGGDHLWKLAEKHLTPQ